MSWTKVDGTPGVGHSEHSQNATKERMMRNETYTEQQIKEHTQRLFDEAKSAGLWDDIREIHQSDAYLDIGRLKEEKKRLAQTNAGLAIDRDTLLNMCKKDQEAVRLLRIENKRLEQANRALSDNRDKLLSVAQKNREECKALRLDNGCLTKELNEAKEKMWKKDALLRQRSAVGDRTRDIRQLERDLDRERNANRVLMRIIVDCLSPRHEAAEFDAAAWDAITKGMK